MVESRGILYVVGICGGVESEYKVKKVSILSMGHIHVSRYVDTKRINVIISSISRGHYMAVAHFYHSKGVS